MELSQKDFELLRSFLLLHYIVVMYIISAIIIVDINDFFKVVYLNHQIKQ